MRICLLILFSLIWNSAFAQNKRKEKALPLPKLQIHKDMLYGMVEPLWELKGSSGNGKKEFQVKGFDLDITVKLVSFLGAKSFRLMFKKVFDRTANFDQELLAYHKSAVQKLKAKGVNQIIGMCMVFPTNSNFKPNHTYSVPHLSDQHYQAWLLKVEDTWQRIAQLFPEIRFWEMGNELNEDFFFHPNEYEGGFGSTSKNGFTEADKVKHIVNYMYYAAKGIKKGNPKAIAVMPGLSPGRKGLESNELAAFINEIYLAIQSGAFPYGEFKSKNTNDYFNVLAWHPYAVLGKIDKDWMQANKTIYDVSLKHGDVKPVFFTEIGFTDYGDKETENIQIAQMQQVFDYVKTDLPFVKNVSAFRLFECSGAMEWGGKGEVHFGYFKEPTSTAGFTAKPKALALRKIYKGKRTHTK
jgi:hypothetical protein